MRTLSLSLVFLAYCFPALANEPATLPGSYEEQRAFLGGAASAFQLANTYAAMRGKALYCAPVNHALDSKLMRDMASQNLVGEQEPMMFIIAAFDQLMRDYPCPSL